VKSFSSLNLTLEIAIKRVFEGHKLHV